MPTSIRSDPAEWESTTAPPPPATESEVLGELRALAGRNTTLVPMLGLGYRYGLPRDEYRDQVFDWLGEIGRAGMGSLGFPVND